MDLKSGACLWAAANGPGPEFSPLVEDQRCDVVVVGGGITGALVCRELTLAGVECVLLDRRGIGGGSTVASTAILQYELDTPLVELGKLIGPSHAARVYRLCLGAIGDYEAVTREVGDRCGFARTTSLYLASSHRDVAGLRAECEARMGAGIRVEFQDRARIESERGFSRPGAIRSVDAAVLVCPGGTCPGHAGVALGRRVRGVLSALWMGGGRAAAFSPMLSCRRPMHPLSLYRWAVQDPETHAVVLRLIYQRLRPGRSPVTLREDFAGTGAESVAWVALKEGRRAVAVDLDGETIQWARERAGRLLGERAASVEFIRGDSLEVGPPGVPAADIVSVLNYSILYLREPAALAGYLRHARACLAPGGVMVMNVFGGPGSVRPGVTSERITPRARLPREEAIPPFEYHWEVRSYDPGTAAMDCRIHFTLDRPGIGGPVELRDAFKYNWRLWTPAELMAAAEGAGFSGVRLWRHTYDPAKGAAGVFLGPVDPGTLAGLERWNAYIVAAV